MMIITNEMEECILSIPSPFDEENVIDLYVTISENTKNDVKIINGSPFITTNVKLDAKILSSDRNSNYFEEENLKLIEEYANSYIKAELEKYLYKISKDYEADIDLFGKYAVKYFSNWDKWIQYNWLESFKDSFFKVEASVNVISCYLIS